MKSPQFSRRQSMAGVAAAEASQWDAEDYDLETVDEWEPLDGGTYETFNFEPEKLLTSGEGTCVGWLMENDDLEIRTVNVFYYPTNVSLGFEGENDDLRAGYLAILTTEQAKELGAALYQAGEEFERRQDAEDEHC